MKYITVATDFIFVVAPLQQDFRRIRRIEASIGTNIDQLVCMNSEAITVPREF